MKKDIDYIENAPSFHPINKPGRHASKPNYDASSIQKEQLVSVLQKYETIIDNKHPSLQVIADGMNLTTVKVRKRLIPTVVYDSETADRVRNCFHKYLVDGLDRSQALGAVINDKYKFCILLPQSLPHIREVPQRERKSLSGWQPASRDDERRVPAGRETGCPNIWTQ